MQLYPMMTHDLEPNTSNHTSFCVHGHTFIPWIWQSGTKIADPKREYHSETQANCNLRHTQISKFELRGESHGGGLGRAKEV
jgi:hypothetical protein